MKREISVRDSIYVTKSFLPPMEEYIEQIAPIWKDTILTNMGNLHNEFQKNLIEYMQVENISLTVNGHLSLELIIQALELTGEVITTPFTFISTTHAIVRNGLTPVFCDINETDYTIDVSKIEELITERTSAIIPVHVYGTVCNIEAIEEIAKKHGLKVIYDAAHAFGVKYRGKGIGAYGDASMFSFHATKIFHTIEGGALTYHSKELERKIERLKNFGIKSQEEIVEIGLNAKMNEFQAAMGICNLRHIDLEIEKRRRVTEWYNDRLKGIQGIKLRVEQKDVEYNYSYYPVLFCEYEFGCNRDVIYEKLKQNNIHARKYFYPLTYEVDCYKERFKNTSNPIAEKVARNILTLPLSSALTEQQVEHITNIVLDEVNR